MAPPTDALASRGRQRWPRLTLPDDAFAAYVNERCPDGVDPSSLALDDLYLAFGCATGDATAIAFFENIFMLAVEKALARREKDPTVVDETKQRIRARLLVAPAGQLPKIAEYRGQGSLTSWLRVVALREHVQAHRATRSDQALPTDDDLPAPALALLSPDVAADHERFAPIVRAAFRTAIAALSARDRTVLKLHYVDGLSLDKIGVMYKVNKATVSRWLSAIRGQLSDAVLAEVQRTAGVSPDETRSLLRLLQSQVELSLRALRDAGLP